MKALSPIFGILIVVFAIAVGPASADWRDQNDPRRLDSTETPDEVHLPLWLSAVPGPIREDPILPSNVGETHFNFRPAPNYDVQPMTKGGPTSAPSLADMSLSALIMFLVGGPPGT